MLEQARPTWRIEGENERKMLNVIINKDRTTWAQITNYYGTVPSKLMTRVQALNDKLMDAVEFANERGDVPREEMDEAEWQTYLLASGYRGIRDDKFADVYYDLAEDYENIYGDE